MPIYEYFCSHCEAKFELLRPLSRASEAASCPHCQQEAERIFSTFACFSSDNGGSASPIGGNPCSSCGATSCDSCGI